MKKFLNGLYISLVLASILVFLQIGFYYAAIPDNFYQSEQSRVSCETLKIKKYPNLSVSLSSSKGEIKAVQAYDSYGNEETVTLSLFGIIPIKQVKVNYVNAPSLIPSGEAFGLKMLTDGVMVTDYGVVEGAVSTAYPAKDGGLLIGDVIISANGIKVTSGDQLTKAVQLNGGETRLTVLRGEEKLELILNPVRSKTDGLYKLGIWTRDSCAGIGTVTYYDPANGSYGGLGHSVSDSDTGMILPLSYGETVPVNINEVIRGLNGSPGELCGAFVPAAPTGSILLNTSCGIFGKCYNIPQKAAIPLGFKQEAEIGEATILTTLEGNTPEEYSVLIEKIDLNSDSEVKNMVIRITDPRLLAKTGGIVQGMSGSPIIQNGKLIGAVTHVFVNDISRGYAIFAENMYSISSQIDAAEGKIETEAA